MIDLLDRHQLTIAWTLGIAWLAAFSEVLARVSGH